MLKRRDSTKRVIGTGGGREVLQGFLMHRKKGSSSWKKRRVSVTCGCIIDGKEQSANLILFEDYEKIDKNGHKPKKVIPLVKAKIEEPGVTSPGTSPGSSSNQSTNMSNQFLIIQTSEVHEFKVCSDSSVLHWVKLLTLLIMFPYSAIPEEPHKNPISEAFRYKLDPKRYGADSVWAVYIMPEEVGTRCNMIGIHTLILRGSVPNKNVGTLEIYNPTDGNTPVVTWDRDKMRRTGKTGNLVFIEIGRRCFGGAGLVWMYVGFDEAYSLRETLHRFLFKGDGKAVSIPTKDTEEIYSNPRASFDSSYPSAYQREQSMSSGYQSYQVSGGQQREDSGFPCSPLSHSFSPDKPPPIHLDKHPSFRKQASLPCGVPRTMSACSSNSPMGSYDTPSFCGHSVGSFNGDELFDERSASRQMVSPPDEGYAEQEDSVSGTFTMDPEQFEHYSHPRRNTEPPLGNQRVSLPHRSNTAPSGSSNYEKMVHPNTGLHQDGYVMMVPSPAGPPAPAPARPNIPSHYSVPAPFRPRPNSNGDANASSSSPRIYENYDRLPTIQETPNKLRRDNYENMARDKIETEPFVEYHPSYENVEIYKQENQRVSRKDSYENVDVTNSGSENRNLPNTSSHFPYAKLHSAVEPAPPTLSPRTRDVTVA